MAYTQNKEGEIVINGWENGIAEDPFSGIADMRSANIHNYPKTVGAGFTITSSTVSGATLARPVARATKMSGGTVAAYDIVDQSGQVFEATTLTGTWTYLSNGNTTTSGDQFIGLAWYKGYLFKFQGSVIYYWNGTIWATFSLGITGTTYHAALVGQDDVLYFCNNTSIGSIREAAGATFDPATAATYVATATALQLPSYDVAVSLAEQGSTLLIGGVLNFIYPWDRISTSFRYPILCAENFIKRMVTVNQNVFVFPGNVNGRGKIYITNGSQCDLFYKIPDHITGYVEPYYYWGDAIYHRNNLVFGMSPTKNSDHLTISGFAEIWALDIGTKAFRSISTISTGSGKANADVIIGSGTSASVAGFGVITGYYDNSSTSGIGYSGTTAGVNGLCIIKTDFIPVGSQLIKKTFNNLEIKLATALASGESITVTVISDLGVLNASVGTMTSTDGFSKTFIVNFDQSQWIQIQLGITGNSETSGVRLREIILR